MATMLQAHPTVMEPAVIEITTLMWASLRVVATGPTFSAAQDVQADAQGRASISLNISRATTGSPVNVAVKAYLQDATAADCTTTFTPVAATAPDPRP